MALEWGEGSASRPGRYLPPGKTRYPLYGWLGGPQGRSGQVRKIPLPPGFDPRAVQPVAIRYTDYATRLTDTYIELEIFIVASRGFICEILAIIMYYVYCCKTSWRWKQKRSKHVGEYWYIWWNVFKIHLHLFLWYVRVKRETYLHWPTLLSFKQLLYKQIYIYIYIYIYWFQNVFLRCPTPRLHCSFSSHWPSLCIDPCVKVWLDKGKTRNMGILRGGTKPCCISLILFTWCCEHRNKEYGEGFEDFKKRRGREERRSI